ncbi:3-keto-steroid reductase [Batrachochytrium dendrobatidis]
MSTSGSLSSVVALVTGANGDIGFGICERLLDHYETIDSSITIILACRNKKKAQQAQQQLISKYFANSVEGEERIQLVLMDLSNTASVFAACDDIKNRFDRIDFLILNAGIMPISHMSLSGAFKDLFTRPATLAKTGGDALIQRTGTVTSEGLGEVFSANVFGHYIIVRELEDIMIKSKSPRIVWMSSTTASPSAMSFEDYQCLKGKYPYESSKRMCEILSLEMNSDLAKKGIHSFIASPGNVSSGITQGAIAGFVLVGVLIILRCLGMSGINITGKNGATSTLHLITAENPNALDNTKVFHSEISVFGKRSVVLLNIDAGDLLARHQLVEKLEILRNECRQRTK